MGKIVWKNFKYNYKNFIAFFISIMLSVSVLFLLVYLSQAAGSIKGIETKALAFAYRSELKEQLRTIIPVMVFITILVIAYSVQFYIQSRMKDYGIFQILGIRKRDMQRMVISEYALSLGSACGIGLLFGKTGTLLLGNIIEKKAGQSLADSIRMEKVYIFTVILCIVMIAGGLIGVFMAADAKGLTGLMKISTVKERRISTPQSVLCLIFGIGMGAGGFFMLDNEPMTAHIAVFLVCSGVFICFNFGMGYLLERFRMSGYYKRNILTWNHVYHYWKRHRNRIVIQILLGTIAIYFSFLMLRGVLHERQMPNDFVCILEESQETSFSRKMKSDFGAECREFPFVWVNETMGDSWIGISEQDYKRLYDGNIELKDNEIFRIWREEGSRESMLDQSGDKILESVTLGRCMNSEWEEPKETYDFRIKGEKISELLGFSLTGMVVLPEKVLREASDNEGFHQVLMIMNVKKGKLEKAGTYVEDQKEQGILEEAFCKRTIEDIDRKERVLNCMVVGIVVGVTLLFGMFVIWLMHFSETEERKARHRFLCVLGMDEKRAKRISDIEILQEILVPTVLTVCLAGGFCGVFIRAYYEGTVSEAARYADERLLVVILLVYFTGELLFLAADRMWCRGQLGKE